MIETSLLTRVETCRQPRSAGKVSAERGKQGGMIVYFLLGIRTARPSQGAVCVSAS